jgi:hypothetical protein
VQQFGSHGPAEQPLGARTKAMTVQTLTEQTSINTASVANDAAGARRMADGVAQARVTMENGMKPATKAAAVFAKVGNEAAKLGRGNLEALAQSTQAYLAGVQNLSRLYIAAVQGLTQHAVDGSKAFGGIKTVQDALTIQASFSRGTIERATTEGVKLQEAALEVAKQVYAPLTQRATLAYQQAKPSLAA